MQGMMQELGQNFMNNLPGLTSDPRFMASIAMMRGIPYEEAYAKAAEAQYNIQRGETLKQEQQRTRILAQTLPGILKQLQGESPQVIFKTLVDAGMKGEEAALFAKNMGAEAPEIKEQTLFNPLSGTPLREHKENGIITSLRVKHPEPSMASLGQMPMKSAPQMAQQPRQGAMPQAGSPMPAEAMGPPMPGQVQPPEYTPGFEPPQLKELNPLQEKIRYEQESEYLKATRTEAEQLVPELGVIKSMKDAVMQFNTGPFAEKRKDWGTFEKWALDTDLFGINAKAANVLTTAKSKILQRLLALQKGNPSDKDLKMVKDMLPDLPNTPESNLFAIDLMESVLWRVHEKDKAAHQYYRQFDTIDGFSEKWRDYEINNPILMYDENQVERINRNNISNWRPNILGKPNAPTPAAIEQPKPKADMNDPRIRALLNSLPRG